MRSFDRWLEKQKGVDFGKDDDKVYMDLVELIPKGVSKVLCVGCGEGEEMTHIKNKNPGADVWGVDIDPRPQDQTNVVVGDAHDLPFGNASFDLVWAKDVLEHVASIPLVLGEMARVTSMYVLVILPSSKWAEDEYHLLIPTADQMLHLGHKLGLPLTGIGYKRYGRQEFNYFTFRKI